MDIQFGWDKMNDDRMDRIIRRKIEQEIETGKWSEELQNLLMQEEDIYFYKSLFDYIDKDFSIEAINGLGAEFGYNPDKHYFGFLNYDGDLFGFKTETDVIEHLKRVLDIEDYFNYEEKTFKTNKGNEYLIEIGTLYDDPNTKIIRLDGYIINDESEIAFYLNNDKMIENTENEILKETKELEKQRVLLTETRENKIIRVCEMINDVLSGDDVFTKEQYQEFQDSIDECKPETNKEHAMLNLAHNYLDLHIFIYGDCN